MKEEKTRKNEGDREMRRGSGEREIFSLYTEEFMHWQSHNAINECIIILLEIYCWSRRHREAWWVQAIFICMFNFTRKTFACYCWNSFQHLLFHHQFLFILLSGPHRLPQFHPLFYNPFTYPRRSKTSQWEWIGMQEWCVCSDVSVCFMTLASLNEREEVSPVIYSDQPPCPICAILHRFALSHTRLPILFHNLHLR